MAFRSMSNQFSNIVRCPISSPCPAVVQQAQAPMACMPLAKTKRVQTTDRHLPLIHRRKAHPTRLPMLTVRVTPDGGLGSYGRPHRTQRTSVNIMFTLTGLTAMLPNKCSLRMCRSIHQHPMICPPQLGLASGGRPRRITFNPRRDTLCSITVLNNVFRSTRKKSKLDSVQEEGSSRTRTLYSGTVVIKRLRARHLHPRRVQKTKTMMKMPS